MFDVTAGFKVAVEGATATVVLKGPHETARSGRVNSMPTG